MTLFTKTVGDGPQPAVFLHGLLGQGKNFGTVARKLTDLYTFTLVDLPDHGLSSWTNEISYTTYVEMVVAKLIDLGAQSNPVTLVGHSLGARIAMLTALDSPSLIKRLAILDMAPGALMKTDLFGFYLDQLIDLDLRQLSSREDADRKLIDAIPQKAIRDFLLQNLHRDAKSAIGWRWVANVELLHEQLDNFNDWPAWGEKSYSGSTAWLAGERSDYVTDASIPLMTKLFPNALLETIPAAGHWIHAEQPDLVAASLRRLATRP